MKRWAGAAAVFGPTLVAARASAPGLGSPFAKANFSVDPSGLGFGVCVTIVFLLGVGLHTESSGLQGFVVAAYEGARGPVQDFT